MLYNVVKGVFVSEQTPMSNHERQYCHHAHVNEYDWFEFKIDTTTYHFMTKVDGEWVSEKINVKDLPLYQVVKGSIYSEPKEVFAMLGNQDAYHWFACKHFYDSL